jgi:hypothetical protein
LVPFITQRQNHQAPFVQTNQPVTDVPYFQPVTTIEPIVNIPEMINIKPIHPAMMSRSQIRFPDHHTELLPNSIFNSISKEHIDNTSVDFMSLMFTGGGVILASFTCFPLFPLVIVFFFSNLTPFVLAVTLLF